MKIKAVDYFMVGDRVRNKSSIYKHGIVQGFDYNKFPHNPRVMILWTRDEDGTTAESQLSWYPDELDIINEAGDIVIPSQPRSTRVVNNEEDS